MKSGFWQIQIEPHHQYKTVFIVLFRQYEWNVMPFELKNTPFEFWQIMNDIFNTYSKFCIMYIDDELICSKFVDQYIQHLKNFSIKSSEML